MLVVGRSFVGLTFVEVRRGFGTADANDCVMADPGTLSREERLLRALQQLCAQAEESIAREGAVTRTPALAAAPTPAATQSAACQNNSADSSRASAMYSIEPRPFRRGSRN